MNFQQDHYRTLGVNADATAEQLRKAYRKLIKRYHPDLHPDDPSCARMTQELNEAWEVLGDEANRAIYDTYCRERDKPKAEAPREPVRKKRWASSPERHYMTGEIFIKYRGTQNETLTKDVLKEIAFDLRPTDVRAKVRDEDIHQDIAPEAFRRAFAAEKILMTIPQPVSCAIIKSDATEHYTLEIKDLTIPALRILDQVKDDGEAFGTLYGQFFGYVEFVVQKEVEVDEPQASGPTGRTEQRTAGAAQFRRQEYYHANGSSYWSDWQRQRRPVQLQPEPGCLGSIFGLFRYGLTGLFLLLIFPKLLLLWPLGLFALFVWGVSGRRVPALFGLVTLGAVLCFIIGLVQTLRHPPVRVTVPQERKVTERPKPTRAKDTLVTHQRSWEDYAGQHYQGTYTLRVCQLDSSSLYKNGLMVPPDPDAAYVQALQELSAADRDRLAGLYQMLDRIQARQHLDKVKFAEMFVSMVQHLPYALILPQACDGSQYQDPQISAYLHKPDARCEADQRFGLNTPLEFLAGLQGDCDTRTLLIYTVLAHYGYHVAIFSSSHYSHSLIGIELPYEGTTYDSPQGRFVLWETTSFSPPGAIANEIADLNYWELTLTNDR